MIMKPLFYWRIGLTNRLYIILTLYMTSNTSNSQSTLPNIQKQSRPRATSLVFESMQPTTNIIKQCRICLQNQQQSFPQQLIKPCKCTGSVSYVHQKCLHKWIQSNRNKTKNSSIQCQLCKYQIKFHSQQINVCITCNEVQENIRNKIALFCLIIVLFAFSITGATISLYVIAEQMQLLERGNGFYFVVILSVCGAIFSFLFFLVSIFLLVSEYLLKKVVSIGKIREFQQRKRNNKIQPTHQPRQNQSMQYISYIQ